MLSKELIKKILYIYIEDDFIDLSLRRVKEIRLISRWLYYDYTLRMMTMNATFAKIYKHNHEKVYLNIQPFDLVMSGRIINGSNYIKIKINVGHYIIITEPNSSRLEMKYNYNNNTSIIVGCNFTHNTHNEIMLNLKIK